MITELDLLYVLGHNDNYFRFKNIIKEHTLTKETKQIFIDLEEYYKQNDSIEQVSWDSFASWFRILRHPNFKPDKHELFQIVFDRLKDYTTSESTDTVIKSFIERDYAVKISTASQSIAQGLDDFTFSDLEEMMFEMNRELKRNPSDVTCEVTSDFEKLFANVTSGGLNWRLPELNVSLGPIRRGNFVLVGSRPESGKTTFLAAEATFMATQASGPVLWFNNEEEGHAVKIRIVQAMLGLSSEQLYRDKLAAWTKYTDLLGGDTEKIKIFDMGAERNHYMFITRMCTRYEPSLIIIDQLRKVHGFERTSTTGVDKLQQLYGWAREIAKEFAPVITAHQARGDAEGVPWIEQNQLEGCQTEIQGELDVQIMMGRTHEPGKEDTRYLNIVKNKLPMGPYTDKKLRHGKFEVQIMPDIARFVGNIKI